MTSLSDYLLTGWQMSTAKIMGNVSLQILDEKKHFKITENRYDSTVPMTLPSLTLPCQRQCWAWLNGINDTTELDSAMSKAMLSLTQRCQWQQRVWLRHVKGNAELDSWVSVTPQSFFQHANTLIQYLRKDEILF